MERGGGGISVEMHSLLSVVSSNPTEPGRIHKLSLLDQAMGLHTLHLVFYYTSNPFNDGPTSLDLDNLRVSLSRLLDQYPIATGRLTRGPDGGWQVKCNDAGVRMLQAKVTTTLDQWLKFAAASQERDLTIWEDMPEDPSFWSPFRIQINNFECGGLAIGLSCTHMLADITSATLLFKSWTEVHRGQTVTNSPIFNLPPPPNSSPNNSSSIPPFCATKSDYPNITPPQKMATATMQFSSRAIQKCLSQVEKQCPHATPFDILVALLWSRITHYSQEPDKKRSLYICLDWRSKGHPEIPYGYFGNALHFSVLDLDGDKMLLSGGIGLVSDYVHRHVEGLKGEDFWSVTSWLEGKGPFGVFGPRLTCISTEQMVGGESIGQPLMYGAEFKTGETPVHVSYHVGNVAGEGLILVLPSAEGGLGRTVTVTLPEDQVAELCKDEVILDLEPTMLVSGRRS